MRIAVIEAQHERLLRLQRQIVASQHQHEITALQEKVAAAEAALADLREEFGVAEIDAASDGVKPED